MWIPITNDNEIPVGTWIGTAYDTELEKRVLVKLERWEISKGTILVIDGTADFNRDYLKVIAYCEVPIYEGLL